MFQQSRKKKAGRFKDHRAPEIIAAEMQRHRLRYNENFWGAGNLLGKPPRSIYPYTVKYFSSYSQNTSKSQLKKFFGKNHFFVGPIHVNRFLLGQKYIGL